MNESLIKDALRRWLRHFLGNPQIVTIDFDADFVADNQIDVTLNGNPLPTVLFDTDQATTLEALRNALQITDPIFKAEITGNRQLTITSLNGATSLVFNSINVTGGLSQAVAVVATVLDPVDVTVIHADQRAPSPLAPYATIRINSVVRNAFEEFRGIDPSTNMMQIAGMRRATVAINYFGDNPIEEISKAYRSLRTYTARSILDEAGIAVIDKNEIQNLTDVLETDYQPESFFDFFIAFAENFEDDFGVIETVETTGNYINPPNPDLVDGPNTIN